jgi:hypothetical protein
MAKRLGKHRVVKVRRDWIMQTVPSMLDAVASALDQGRTELFEIPLATVVANVAKALRDEQNFAPV